MSITIKTENDWHDVGRPLSCSASQLPRFLIIIVVVLYYYVISIVVGLMLSCVLVCA